MKYNIIFPGRLFKILKIFERNRGRRIDRDRSKHFFSQCPILYFKFFFFGGGGYFFLECKYILVKILLRRNNKTAIPVFLKSGTDLSRSIS